MFEGVSTFHENDFLHSVHSPRSIFSFLKRGLFPTIPLRDEKVKVLKAVPELSLSDVVLGQVILPTLFVSFVCLFF